MQTDFPSELDAGARWSSVLGVGGALVTTFALGFTEGCLEIERRPIPLRFALRFASVNVLPSVVFKSIPARHVAAASGVPLSALVTDADLASSRSVAVGKRLVLVKSIRALRLATGSYGLAWSLWRWHKADTTSRDNNANQEGLKRKENVIRLAPVNSPLSRVSKRNHGDHILTMPVNKASWKNEGANKVLDTVNWETMGIDVQFGEGGEEGERTKVIEVELSDVETTVEYTAELKTKASNGDGTSVCSVAVLPLCRPPIPSSVADSFDVCFNPLSAVLTFIASVCHARGVTHVILAGAQDESGQENRDANTLWLHLSTSQLSAGLLYRHGITSSVQTEHDKNPADEHEEKLTADSSNDGNSEIVFFISKSLNAGHSAARKMTEQDLIAQQNAYFIVEESLYGQNIPSEAVQAESELLRMKETNTVEHQEQSEIGISTYMSVADVTDQTLQGIRDLVRLGKRADVVQAHVYRVFGTQRVVAPARLDQFSDMNV